MSLILPQNIFGSITFIVGKVKDGNFIKHSNSVFYKFIFFEVYKDVSDMRMKGRW